MLLITPVGLSQMGVTQFAYWLLATYVSGLVVSPDLGIGNSVVNEFGADHAKGIGLQTHETRIRGLIKLLSIVALTWLLAGVIVAAVYAMSSGQQGDEVTVFVSLGLGLFCFLSAVPASVVQRIQLSQEKASHAVLWEGVGKTVGLGLSLAVLVWAPNLYLLIVSYMLPVSIFSWLNAFLFLKSHGMARVGKMPTVAQAVRQNRHTFSVGKWFLVMQVCYLFISALDPYLVNTFGSPNDLVYFNVAKRPFDLLPMAVSIYALALWPVFRRLRTHANTARLHRLFFAVTLASVGLAALGSLLIIVVRGPLYSYLSGGRVDPNLADLFYFLLLMVSTASVLISTNYLNAVDQIRSQTWVFVAGAILLIVAKVVSLATGNVHTFVMASAVSYFAFIALPLLILCSQTKNKAPRLGFVRRSPAAVREV
ncbi:lipopolysaccharide biosynthesis protein [Cryobacterium sp. TMT3-29-2]|uniref:lipopolysaccharide biosynthesis protein n=1 Tax=Cryobacterium sp. TMT3-29-2 TaxID=2555867 RepID=UPI0010742D55|nr:hypothetical protein [Cryobacterium sp. TMT3-29-2]TFC83133.1 hypothetical protein E3O67_15280 [Cryobacterium sp. TMT3-29-2]